MRSAQRLLCGALSRPLRPPRMMSSREDRYVSREVKPGVWKRFSARTNKAIVDRNATIMSRPELGNEHTHKAHQFEAILGKMFSTTLASWHIEKPTEIQQLGLSAIMDQQRVVVASPTGTGKTLAYLLPVFARLKMDKLAQQAQVEVQQPEQSQEEKEKKADEEEHEKRAVPSPSVLILAPSRDLVHQIGSVSKNLGWKEGIKVRAVSGRMSRSKVSRVWKATHNKFDVLVTTTASLSQAIRDWQVSLDKVRYVILDEADTLLEWRFYQEVRPILDIIESNPVFQPTTTTTPAVEGDNTTNTGGDPTAAAGGGSGGGGSVSTAGGGGTRVGGGEQSITIVEEGPAPGRVNVRHHPGPVIVLVLATFTKVVTEFIKTRYGAKPLVHGFVTVKAKGLHEAPKQLKHIFMDTQRHSKMDHLADLLRQSGHVEEDFINELANSVPQQSVSTTTTTPTPDGTRQQPTDDTAQPADDTSTANDQPQQPQDMVEDDFDWGTDFQAAPVTYSGVYQRQLEVVDLPTTVGGGGGGSGGSDAGGSDSGGGQSTTTNNDTDSQAEEDPFESNDPVDWMNVQWRTEKRLHLAPVHQGQKDCVIVFCNTGTGVTFVHRRLLERGIHNIPYTREVLDRTQRKTNILRWQKERGVLVSTDSLSRGMDFRNVQHVINFDFPIEAVTYVHRVGRAGRMGKQGRVSSLVEKGDRNLSERIKSMLWKRKSLEGVTYKSRHKLPPKGSLLRQRQKENREGVKRKHHKSDMIFQMHMRKFASKTLRKGKANYGWEPFHKLERRTTRVQRQMRKGHVHAL